MIKFLLDFLNYLDYTINYKNYDVMIKEFKVSKEYNYLGEVPEFKKLPEFYLIDKGKVGCGGTSVALNNDVDSIICVPFVELVDNKVAQYGDKVIGVHGSSPAYLIKDYLENCKGPKKIICTYDSLPKVIKYTGFDYFLLIDELHLLFTQYVFRDNAVRNVLDTFRKFRSWAFLTATPIENDLMLEELKDIPTYKITWEKNNIVKVKAIQCKQLAATVKKEIMQFINNEKFGNAHFFVNSVEFIANMIKACNLTEDNTRVIFSKNNKTYKNTVQGINNSKTSTAAKKINFYTSTCFEGCDIMDEEGKIYIISDSAKAQTLADISTQVSQIAGRIRNTKYGDQITHFYKQTRYCEDLSYEEFKEVVFNTEKKAKIFVEKVNSDDDLKEGMKESIYPYITKIDDIFVFDPNRLKLDIYNFKITHHLYSLNVNIVNAYKENGYEVSNIEDKTSDKLLKNNKAKTSFKEAFEEYMKLKNITGFNFSLVDDERKALIRNKYPFIEDAINILGEDGIKTLQYKVGSIKQMLILVNEKMNNKAKIAKLLLGAYWFKTGNFVSSEFLKNEFQEIYLALDIDVKSYSKNDVLEFCELKDKVKKVDGKSKRGYVITFIKIK